MKNQTSSKTPVVKRKSFYSQWMENVYPELNNEFEESKMKLQEALNKQSSKAFEYLDECYAKLDDIIKVLYSNRRSIKDKTIIGNFYKKLYEVQLLDSRLNDLDGQNKILSNINQSTAYYETAESNIESIFQNDYVKHKILNNIYRFSKNANDALQIRKHENHVNKDLLTNIRIISKKYQAEFRRLFAEEFIARESNPNLYSIKTEIIQPLTYALHYYLRASSESQTTLNEGNNFEQPKIETFNYLLDYYIKTFQKAMHDDEQKLKDYYLRDIYNLIKSELDNLNEYKLTRSQLDQNLLNQFDKLASIVATFKIRESKRPTKRFGVLGKRNINTNVEELPESKKTKMDVEDNSETLQSQMQGATDVALETTETTHQSVNENNKAEVNFDDKQPTIIIDLEDIVLTDTISSEATRSTTIEVGPSDSNRFEKLENIQVHFNNTKRFLILDSDEDEDKSISKTIAFETTTPQIAVNDNINANEDIVREVTSNRLITHSNLNLLSTHAINLALGSTHSIELMNQFLSEDKKINFSARRTNNKNIETDKSFLNNTNKIRKQHKTRSSSKKESSTPYVSISMETEDGITRELEKAVEGNLWKLYPKFFRVESLPFKSQAERSFAPLDLAKRKEERRNFENVNLMKKEIIEKHKNIRDDHRKYQKELDKKRELEEKKKMRKASAMDEPKSSGRTRSRKK